MHILIAAAGIAAAVYFFILRARNASEVATELMDVANDVRLAARRFGFQRRTNVHPVESIEDDKVAIAAAAFAFLHIDATPTREEIDGLSKALDDCFPLTRAEADELLVLARWLTDQCNSPEAAVSRLSRKLYKLSGKPAVGPMMEVLQAMMQNAEIEMTDRKRDALEDISRALHV